MGAGNGARFSGRAAGSTLNHRAVSPAPVYFIFIRMYVHVSVCGYQQKEVLSGAGITGGINCLIRVVGVELRSPARAARALKPLPPLLKTLHQLQSSV